MANLLRAAVESAIPTLENAPIRDRANKKESTAY